MTKLSLLFSLFLSTTVTFAVLILSLVAKVTLATLIFRVIVVFFTFSLLGIIAGSLVEIFIFPFGQKIEDERLREELKLPNPEIENMLGDILKQNVENNESKATSKNTFSPLSFPKVTIQNVNENRNLVDKANP